MGYRIYTIDERNRIFGPAQLLEAVDDNSAIKKVAEFLDGQVIELWQGSRLLVRLDPKPHF